MTVLHTSTHSGGTPFLLFKPPFDNRGGALYWLLGTSVRERGPLGFHRSPLFSGQGDLSHRNCREIVLMDQRKQACMGSRLSGVLPWNMVDKSSSPPQTDSGAGFGEETVQIDLLSPE